jgi:hypothetical protein
MSLVVGNSSDRVVKQQLRQGCQATALQVQLLKLECLSSTPEALLLKLCSSSSSNLITTPVP